MGLIIFALVILLTFFVYRQTRSLLWSVVAFAVAYMVLPFLFDQIKLISIEDAATNPKANPAGTSTNTSIALNRVRKTCNCN